MSRFLYLTDTHLGCTSEGYCLQPRYLDRFEILWDALKRWLGENPVDCIVHGGDATDRGDADQIDRVLDWLRQLDVPAYLCLGNHDLTQPDSIALWRSRGADVLSGGRDSFGLDLGDARLYILGHHWSANGPSFRWIPDEPSQPTIDAKQQRELDAFLAESAVPVILITHAPLNDVDAFQRGSDEPFHPPYPPYAQTLHRILASLPRVRLVMAGHNHAHSVYDHGGFISCTTASFQERPGLARLVSIEATGIDVQTVALGPVAGLEDALTLENAWAVGGPAQQHFRVPLSRIIHHEEAKARRNPVV